MRLPTALLASLLPAVVAMAQNYPSMTEADMQNMMQVMQKVQACMEQVDQAELERLQQTSEQLMQGIDALCAQGKRDQAQDKAYEYAKKMSSDPTMQQMRKCGQMAEGAIPMDIMPKTFDEKEYADKHVCDS